MFLHCHNTKMPSTVLMENVAGFTNIFFTKSTHYDWWERQGVEVEAVAENAGKAVAVTGARNCLILAVTSLQTLQQLQQQRDCLLKSQVTRPSASENRCKLYPP